MTQNAGLKQSLEASKLRSCRGLISALVCFAGTCVWWCVVSRRWTAAQWQAPCWESTSRTPKPGRSSCIFHGALNRHHVPSTPSLCLQLHVESSRVPGDLHLTAADPRPSPLNLTSIHWSREDFSLTADHLLLESLWTQHTYFDGAFKRYCTVFIGSIVYYYCQVYNFSAIL